MLKVMTIVGTRPEIIRLSRVIHQLDRHCDHVLVHTGQNYDYELNEVFFSDLAIRRPDAFLEAARDTVWAPVRTCIKSAGLKMPRAHGLATIPTMGDSG